MVRLNPRSLRVLSQDGSADMMHSVEGADHVGAFLREARETTGRSAADVADTLRIRRIYLEAIEDGRFDELPGATYAVGFVRSYAAYLNLDAPGLVARFKKEASGIENKQELEFPTPLPEGRFPGGLLISVCLLLAGAAFGGWYWYQSQSGIEVARVPPPLSKKVAGPAQLPSTAAFLEENSLKGKFETNALEATASSVPGLTLDTAPPASVDEATAVADPVGREPTETALDASETPAYPNPPSPALSSEPTIAALPKVEGLATSSATVSNREGRTFGARNASARIILHAMDNTWVQVRDADQSVVLTQMLEAGDQYMVPNRKGLRLMTGNAGGLQILVDGEVVPAVGAHGESRRNVRLDPASLRNGTAVVH